MADEPQKPRDIARKVATDLSQVDAASIASKRLALTGNASDPTEALEQTKRLAVRALRGLEHLEEEELVARLQQMLNHLWGAVQELQNAKFDGNNPQERWNRSVQGFSDLFRDPGSRQSPDNNQKPNVAREIRELFSYSIACRFEGENLPTLATETKSLREQVERDAAEIARVLEDVRAAPGRWTAQTFSNEFEKQANQHASAAKTSLWAAAGLMLLSATVAVLLAVCMPNMGSTEIVGGLTRLFVVSLFASAVFVAFRSFRANRHLEISNQHRAAVLRTYDLLMKSTTDEATKTAFLREAASCIFQAGTTGFLGDKEFKLDQQALDILRDAIVKKAS